MKNNKVFNWMLNPSNKSNTVNSNSKDKNSGGYGNNISKHKADKVVISNINYNDDDDDDRGERESKTSVTSLKSKSRTITPSAFSKRV